MRERIESLEGLRGFMAFWVFVTHVTTMAGMPFDKNHGLGIVLANGGYAVGVFIILSGFVIAMMLSRQTNDPYSVFLARRGFRLFPAYLVCLAISIILLEPSLTVLREIPWRASKLEERIQIFTDTKNYYLPHLLLHLTMLHGLVSDQILPNTSYAFMGQAWSLSLEWQFYIIAPFVFALINKKAQNFIVRMFVLLGLVGLNFIFKQPSFILTQLSMFFVGYYSFQFFKEYRTGEINFSYYLFRMIVQGAIIMILGMEFISYLIWMIVIVAAIQKNSFIGKLQKQVLENKFSLWLGRVSYSFYCVHMVCIYGVSYLLIITFGVRQHLPYMVLLISISLILTLILSQLLNKFVENPMIKAGKNLTEPWTKNLKRALNS